ncbi:MAG: biotin transporter BioY [Faecalibacillus faecis]
MLFQIKTRVPIGLACIIGSVMRLYFIGTLWFMFVTKMNLSASLMMCVVPFIPGASYKNSISLLFK